MTVPLLFQDYTGNAPKRVGLRHPTIAPYGAFETGDGKQIVISIQNEREWARFADDILGHPEWATDGAFCSAVLRVENRTELDKIIADTFAKLKSDDICEKLLRSQIAFGRLNDVEGLSTHPALRRIRIDSPSGPIDLPAPPVKIVGKKREYGPIPEIGSHTDHIRKEFAENG